MPGLLRPHRILLRQCKTGALNLLPKPAQLAARLELDMRKLKVLIIDDEEDYCMIMKSYFMGMNYEVFVAHTLREGLRLLESERPDILLLDNNLPDGKGRDWIDSIIEKYPEIRIYFISAYLQKADFSTPHRNVIVWEKPILLSVLDKTFRRDVNHNAQ
jgi:DNA-binding NtrC family response regulator